MSVVDDPRTTVRRRPPRSVRRAGYVVGALANALLLWLVAVAPGWQAVPFLTESFAGVLPLVTATSVVGVAANLAYVAIDTPRARAVGDLATTTVGIVAMVALWRAFPFDVDGQAVPWETVVRVLLVLALVGSAIAILVAVVTLVGGRRPGERR